MKVELDLDALERAERIADEPGELIALVNHIPALIAEVRRLREALDEREGDMHMRIRQGYDKTVADCWRAKVAEVERERDEAREEVEHFKAGQDGAFRHIEAQEAKVEAICAVVEAARVCREREKTWFCKEARDEAARTLDAALARYDELEKKQ